MNSSKRKKKVTTPVSTQKKYRHDEPITSNNNRFSELDAEDDSQPLEENPLKPPPIFIPCVDDIRKMIQCLASIIPQVDFNYKSLRDGQIKLLVKTIESYRKVVKYLESKNICFHTYQLKNERSYRVVLKGLHHTTSTTDIKGELLSMGHKVRCVTNVRSQITKNPLPMFFVDLDPSPNNNKIYDVKYISNAVVSIEPQRKTNDIVQCHRCQQFGHTKGYCKKPFVCVKCGMDHSTAECTKSKDVPPKCVHCLQNHTANYKGCQVYKSLRQKINSNYRVNRQQFAMNSHESYMRNLQYTNYNNCHTGASYAEALKQNKESETSTLKNIENMFGQLMNMLTLLISKLCK